MEQNEATKAGLHTGTATGTQGEASAMLDVEQVAKLLHCSVRHLYRLVDRGFAPSAIKLGTTLNRWPRATIDAWIRAGCPDCRKGWRP